MDWSKREGMDEEERWFYDQGYQDGLKAAEKRGKRLPTIEPKKARWHKRNNVNFSPFDGSSEYEFTCGWCGGTADRITNYCPNCGAKMESSDELKSE